MPGKKSTEQMPDPRDPTKPITKQQLDRRMQYEKRKEKLANDPEALRTSKLKNKQAVTKCRKKKYVNPNTGKESPNGYTRGQMYYIQSCIKKTIKEALLADVADELTDKQKTSPRNSTDQNKAMSEVADSSMQSDSTSGSQQATNIPKEQPQPLPFPPLPAVPLVVPEEIKNQFLEQHLPEWSAKKKISDSGIFSLPSINELLNSPTSDTLDLRTKRS